MAAKRVIKFHCLNDRWYNLNVFDYLVQWNKTVASKAQKEVKDFFRKYWSKDCVCEELKCRPLLRNSYRVDLINIDKKIAVEYHGCHSRYNPYFHKSIDDFYDSVERDVKKKMFLEKNGYLLIEIYPKNLPLTKEFLDSKYPSWR